MKFSPRGLVISTAVCMLTVVACAKDAPTAPAPTATPTLPSTPPPPPPAVATKLLPTTPTLQSGWAGFPVRTMPGVQVVDQNGKPVSGASVTFTYTKQNGVTRASVAGTNLEGVAYTDWTLRDDGQQDTLVASLGTLAPVVFIADAKKQLITDAFDLQMIGSQTLPINYSGGGSSWTVEGGKFIFAADGTYAWGYVIDGSSRVGPNGHYTFIDPNTVKFYLPAGSYGPFYEARNGLFATGVIDGDRMTVAYEDFVDFDVEVYSRSR